MLVERLGGRAPAERLAWSAVERGSDRLELLGGVSGEVRAFGAISNPSNPRDMAMLRCAQCGGNKIRLREKMGKSEMRTAGHQCFLPQRDLKKRGALLSWIEENFLDVLAESRAILNARSRPGSYLPVSIALMHCRVTPTDSASSA